LSDQDVTLSFEWSLFAPVAAMPEASSGLLIGWPRRVRHPACPSLRRLSRTATSRPWYKAALAPHRPGRNRASSHDPIARQYRFVPQLTLDFLVEITPCGRVDGRQPASRVSPGSRLRPIIATATCRSEAKHGLKSAALPRCENGGGGGNRTRVRTGSPGHFRRVDEPVAAPADRSLELTASTFAWTWSTWIE
jgi:hypothetical protein